MSNYRIGLSMGDGDFETVASVPTEWVERYDRLVRENLRLSATAEFWKGKYERLVDATVEGPLKPTQVIVRPATTLNDLAAEIHATAKDKGWYDPPQSFGERVCMMHSELSEALEAYRSKSPIWFVDVDGKPEGWAVELADCIIRILDFMASYGINIDKIVRDKMDYNKTRPYRHGGKAL